MDNHAYVKTITTDPQAQRRCLIAMKKYGENHWWESGVDARTLAYYQLNELVLLVVPFSRFHQAVEEALGRPVHTHEFATNKAALQREVRQAFQSKRTPTLAQRQEHYTRGIQSLFDPRHKR